MGLITSEGIRPLESTDRVTAISDQEKSTTTIKQIKSFVGMIHHYWKFVQFRAEILKSLYDVCKSDGLYCNSNCNKAFEEIKKQLAANT